MNLDTTSKTLEVKLGGAITTNQPNWTAHFYDVRQADITTTAVSELQGNTNGATVVTMVPAPPGGVTRVIKEVTIQNNDTVTQTITVQIDNGGIPELVVQIAIAAGSTLQFSGAWSVIPAPGGVAGPPGPSGPIGIQGQQGIAGFDGEDGIDGISIQGLPGATGATGATGAAGPVGPVAIIDGIDGEDSLVPGPQGLQGNTGATGATGPQGIQGNPGPPPLNFDGEDGFDAIVGMPGATGAAGTNGATGAQGPPGPVFFAFDGDEGEQGIPGPAGANGSSGSSVVTLLESKSGNTTATGASDVDTVAISGLTALDEIWITGTLEAQTQQTTGYTIRSGTTIIWRPDNQAVIPAGNIIAFRVVISQSVQSATIVLAEGDITLMNGAGVFSDTYGASQSIIAQWSAPASYQGSWTLGLHFLGQTSGGTSNWRWKVEKHAGQ